jgi:SAM-dependent methyltransferase
MPRPRRLREDLDTWQRHASVADLVGEASVRILDVGGVPGRLRRQLPHAEIVAVNVEAPADVLFDGATLPFPDRAFDAVTSIDVLEHLERDERALHLAEALRVARHRVVLCCPLGTDEHIAAERDLADWYASLSGERHRFLEEHLQRGLPTESELRALAREVADGFEVSLVFHGDYRRTEELFRLEALAHFRGRIGDRARFAYRRLRAGLPSDLSETSGSYSNRCYLIAIARPSGEGRE